MQTMSRGLELIPIRDEVYFNSPDIEIVKRIVEGNATIDDIIWYGLDINSIGIYWAIDSSGFSSDEFSGIGNLEEAYYSCLEEDREEVFLDTIRLILTVEVPMINGKPWEFDDNKTYDDSWLPRGTKLNLVSLKYDAGNSRMKEAIQYPISITAIKKPKSKMISKMKISKRELEMILDLRKKSGE